MPEPAAYVVTRPKPTSGVGSNLLSLEGAVWLAGKLGRDVIVDWRGSAFLLDPSLNYFTTCFESVPAIGDVGMRYTGDGLELPDPSGGEWLEVEPGDVPGILSGATALPPYLLLQTFHGSERIDRESTAAAQHWRLKKFFESIRPAAPVDDAIEAFWNESLRDRFVVGINISTGNGEYAKGQPAYGKVNVELFENEERFRRRVGAAVESCLRRLPRYLADDARVFFATDGYPMRDTLAQLPRATTRRAYFPPAGTGRHYRDYHEQGYSDIEAARDTVADMLMLGRCNAFVRNTGTVFNSYALVSTNWFDGNVQTVDTRFASYWLKTASAQVRRRLGA